MGRKRATTKGARRMVDLVSRFSWSFTRQSAFEACKRRYYYQYYGHWGGWDRAAPPEAQLCYRLGKMKSLPMVTGSIVHEQIGALLESIRRGRPFALPELQLGAAKKLALAVGQSQDRRWRNDPKRNTNLYEHYYGGGLPPEAVTAAEAHASGCLERFFSSGVLDVIALSEPRSWRIEEKAEWQVEGIQVMAIADLALPAEGRLVIYDWKTGRDDGAYDAQLGVYGLAAREVWGYAPAQTVLRLLYLGDGVLKEHAFSEAQAEDAGRAIAEGAGKMLALLTDRARNTAHRDAFPMTPDRARCDPCFFQELCYGSPGRVVRPLPNEQVPPEKGDQPS
jgi:hypothetical protein